MNIKGVLLFSGWLCCFTPLYAQYRVSFIIANHPDTPRHPTCYVAGTMNNWDPAESNYRFGDAEQRGRLTIRLDSGAYAFKITRGNWQTVECAPDGNDIANRTIVIHSDTVIRLRVAAWKDHFKSIRKPHTMSAHVHIIDTAFAIPQLSRTRRIWIYLPPGYASGTRKYPVLYMQDGQNLFDAATAAYGEWGVDEILDSLAEKDGPESIVVGIDNGGDKRINEYNPYDNAKYGKGEGKAYATFLAETLKPFIDAHFRTFTDAANTGIAGSSMGGLIAFYTWLKYPGVFGKAGIFSPSFWIAPTLENDIHLTEVHRQDHIYFIAGDAESATMVADMQGVYKVLTGQGMSREHMKIKVVPGGKHSESYWHQEFGQVYSWLHSPE